MWVEPAIRRVNVVHVVQRAESILDRELKRRADAMEKGVKGDGRRLNASIGAARARLVAELRAQQPGRTRKVAEFDVLQFPNRAQKVQKEDAPHTPGDYPTIQRTLEAADLPDATLAAALLFALTTLEKPGTQFPGMNEDFRVLLRGYGVLGALESATRSQGAYILLASQLVEVASGLAKDVESIFDPVNFPHAMGQFVKTIREEGTKLLEDASRAALARLGLPHDGEFMTPEALTETATRVADTMRAAVEEALKKHGGNQG